MDDVRTIKVGGREFLATPCRIIPFGNLGELEEIMDQLRKPGRIELQEPCSVEITPPGYHVRQIPRGTYGEASKILEEAAEFGDAIEQDAKVMALVELSDMMGAVQGYLNNHFPGTTIDDLCQMAAITTRARNNGQWSERR